MAVRFVFILIMIATIWSPNLIAQSNKSGNENKAPNEFSDIQIQLYPSNAKLNCHNSSTIDGSWNSISFDELPQNQHFCIRAWINIDKSRLSKNASLLIGMLGASTFYWDGKVISENGEVGGTSETELPGIIKTLVRIPEDGLTNGKHMLTGEISTFHVGKELDSIGYVLAIVNEQKLHSSILILSIFSALFIGISLVLSFIFQLIYWIYQKEVSYQIFSLFCLTSSFILISEQAKFWLDYTYNWHIVRLSLIYVFTFFASSLLPLFYLFNYPLPRKKAIFSLILFSLVALSFVKLGYDQTSLLLFFGALLWALVINLYILLKCKQGIANVLIMCFSLLFLYFIPEYFTEFGFSLVFIIIVMTMLISLIQEMHFNKLNALKAQRVKFELLRRNIQPHFLMNCLTQLMELIEVKPKSAVEFIAVLSDEFRQLSKQNDKQQVSLVDEIALCNKHLEIMSFRYQHDYHLEIMGDVQKINIPPSILHSQIENCFTHNEISSNRAFELIVLKRKSRITLMLKTPIERKIDHEGTGLGERYINAMLSEADQANNNTQKSSFESYEECQYWVSKFEFSA